MSGVVSSPAYLPVAGGFWPGSARPPRGQLLFDCDFESGNLEYIEKVDDMEYDLRIRGDTRNERHSVFFYFRVTNARRNQRVTLHIHNYSKRKSLFREGFTPVVRSTSKPAWERLPTKSIFYYRCPRHAQRSCLSISHCFDREWSSTGGEEEYFFAYTYPYTYQDLQRYLTALDARHTSEGIYRRDLLANSLQGRRLDLICITSEENMKTRVKDAAAIAALHSNHGWRGTASNNSAGSSASPLRCVFFTARVHPGETPASYVCAGILDFLLSSDPVARLLRSHVVFYIVPMLNPDGVALGNYRCNSLGYDLNRHWLYPERAEQPTIAATKSFLLFLARDASVELAYFVDLHAHTSALSTFLFCNPASDERAQARVDELPRLLDAQSDHFSFASTRTLDAGLKDKEGTGRKALGDVLAFARTICYTLEVSFFCSLKAGRRSAPYTQHTYIEIGRSVAQTMARALHIDGTPRPSLVGGGGMPLSSSAFSIVGHAVASSEPNSRTSSHSASPISSSSSPNTAPVRASQPTSSRMRPQSIAVGGYRRAHSPASAGMRLSSDAPPPRRINRRRSESQDLALVASAVTHSRQAALAHALNLLSRQVGTSSASHSDWGWPAAAATYATAGSGSGSSGAAYARSPHASALATGPNPYRMPALTYGRARLTLT